MFKDIAKLEDCLVLVVDDSALICTVLTQSLSALCHVAVVHSAEKAVSFCMENKPDLVLMDWVLEGMSGLDACKRMQVLPELADIPVIFVTSNDSEYSQNCCWDAGAVDFISKPIVSSTLLNRVETHLKYKLQADSLRSFSYVDSLTGLYNRRFFDLEISRLLKQKQRAKQPFSALMIDVDFFKKYNDEFGHLEGDQALKKVALILGSSGRRPLDSVFRYGGEEFAMLLPNTSHLGAARVAKYLVDAVKDLNISHPASEYNVLTISVGMASVDAHEIIEPTSLLAQADSALYKAKEAGRNGFLPQYIKSA